MIEPTNLNMKKLSMKTMKKRGQLETIVALIVLAVVLVGGYFVAVTSKGSYVQGNIVLEQSKYIGNSESKLVCSISEIGNVPIANRYSFLRLEDAFKLGYTYSENCIN